MRALELKEINTIAGGQDMAADFQSYYDARELVDDILGSAVAFGAVNCLVTGTLNASSLAHGAMVGAMIGAGVEGVKYVVGQFLPSYPSVDA